MSSEQQRQLLDRVQRRLERGAWEERQIAERLDYSAIDALAPQLPSPTHDAAAEVASFALGLAGKRRLARRAPRDGRLRRLVLHFALAAMLALTAVASSACESTDDTTVESIDVDDLSTVSGAEAAVIRAARGTPATFDNLVLIDPGGADRRWALLVPVETIGKPAELSTAPVLVDREGAGLDQPGAIYRIAARAVPLESRHGPTQFLDPIVPAQNRGPHGDQTAVQTARETLLNRWQKDERFAAATRAIAGTPTLLDAAYNAQAAYSAGGTHTFANGVVLRVDPDQPVIEVSDRALVDSDEPMRAEDVVFVAVRPSEKALYDPGSVITLRNVVLERHVLGQGSGHELFIANAALEGARVEPTGSLDLAAILNRRLQRTDADLTIQAQELSADPSLAPPPVAAAAAASVPTPIVVRERVYGGPSFLNDYLMWRWLTQGNYYSGSRSFVGNPPGSTTRPSGDFYYTAPTSTTASTAPGAGQATSRSQALQAARNAVSGQSAGTGGGTAATAKSASLNSERVSAATSKAASLAGQSSSSSAGKSVASVARPAATGSVAARGAGSVVSASRASGAAGGKSSSAGFSSGSKGIGGSSA